MDKRIYKRVHPIAIEVMAEKGIEIEASQPKNVSQYRGRIPVRHLVIVCDGANETCPRIFPGMLNRMFWQFDDPAAYQGSPEATREKFRAIRDEIEARIKQWLRETP